MLAPALDTIWALMPAAETEFMGNSRHRTAADLTGVTEARLGVRKQAIAGATNAQLRIQYSTTDGGTWNYLDHSAGPAVAINTTNSTLKSSWVNLNAAAKADVLLRIVGIDGNAVASPEFGNITVQFR
jgi:hypothetical protein